MIWDLIVLNVIKDKIIGFGGVKNFMTGIRNKSITIFFTVILMVMIFKIPVYSQVVEVAKELWNAIPEEQKKEIKDKAIEAGKEVASNAVTIGKDLTNRTVDGVKSTLKNIEETIKRPEVCESNIIKNFNYSCLVDKQKETNQAYIEICGKKALLAVGNYSVPAVDDMPEVNIKVTFEMKDKIYTHDLTKRDFKKDGKIHLYWDLDYKDVDPDKPINVTFTGSVNPNLKNTTSLKIDDSFNSPSSFWFSSRREANVKAFGEVKNK